jgi:small subunit ribosomal protein S11
LILDLRLASRLNVIDKSKIKNLKFTMAKAGGKKKVFRKKEKKNVPVGIAHVAASFNNTMISITDLEGNLIAQSSAGARGFRGSRKGTPFAAQQAAYEAAKKAHEAGMQQCEVRVKGPGGGRESAIRAIANAGIRVITIRDSTPIPHNGCRPPKRRRV